MKYISAELAYESKENTDCNICNVKYLFNSTMFHCPMGKNEKYHTNGYSICLECAMNKHENKFKYNKQLRQIKAIMNTNDDHDESIKEILIQNNGDVQNTLQLFLN
eukprot:198264_1